MVEMRASRPGEIPRQKELWRAAFGDEERYIDWFYRCCGDPEDILVLAEDGVVVSMLALPPVELVSAGGARASGRYVYALTTDTACRDRGYGRLLLRYTDHCLRERGLDCVTVVPAEPSLHRFFGSAGFRPCFSFRGLEFSRRELPPPAPEDRVRPADPGTYCRVRETLLAGLNRVCYGGGLLELQQGFSRMSGGDLYLLNVAGETGCAAVELADGGEVLCKELLIAPSQTARAAAAVAALHPGAGPCRVRVPVRPEGPEGPEVPFGMVKWYNREKEAAWGGGTACYMGLGFD